jgi:DNA invertase Pin-like site-specific DNA recombinase
VTRIDRLARSTFDLFAIIKSVTGAKARFRPLAEPWADTGTATGRLMIAVRGDLAADLARSWASAPARSRVYDPDEGSAGR